MRAVIYARVSTVQNQTVDNQLDILREVAKSKGYTIVKEYCDEGISGAKGRTERQQFDQLIKGATKKEFDTILTFSVCRLGRSLSDLVSFLDEIQSVNCNLYIHQSGLDTSTPTGKMMFQMIGIFSEFERQIIKNRVLAGQQRFIKNGGKMGRPSKVTEGLIHSVKFMKDSGIGIRKIARDLQIGVSTVYRVLES